MNVFIVFVKFLSWIVAIWVRLAYWGECGPKVSEGGSTAKMKYIITIKIKKIMDSGEPGPFGLPSGSVPDGEN